MHTTQTPKRPSRLRIGITGIVALALIAITGVPAQAASTALTGTVNCTGTWFQYETVRKTSSTGPTELYLTKAAGSPRGGYAMTVGGVRIVATGGTHSNTFYYGAPSWGTLIPSGTYIEDTRFKMRAKMQTSSGACQNEWKGDLYY